MHFNIGNVIKLLRKHKNLTQDALANNICSIKQLSRIESNKSIPTSLLLKEFSYKLGEDISEYFLYLDQDDPILSKQKIVELENFLLSSDYESCFNLSQSCIDDVICRSNFYYRQLLWYKYTAALHLSYIKDPELEDFLSLTMTNLKLSTLDKIFDSFIKPFDYRVISSIILIYLKNNNYDLAKHYLIMTIKSFEKNYIASHDYSYLKALYNLSRIYYMIDKDYEASLHYSSKGLSKCISNGVIYFLDDFCLLKGKSLYHLGKIEEGRELIKTFIYLSKLTDHHKNLERIIVNLKELYKV